MEGPLGLGPSSYRFGRARRRAAAPSSSSSESLLPSGLASVFVLLNSGSLGLLGSVRGSAAVTPPDFVCSNSSAAECELEFEVTLEDDFLSWTLSPEILDFDFLECFFFSDLLSLLLSALTDKLSDFFSSGPK